MAKPFDPAVAGMLQPKRVLVPQRKTTKSWLSDMSGSVKLWDVGGEKKWRREEEKATTAAALAKRDAAQAKKAALRVGACGWEVCGPAALRKRQVDALPCVWAEE